MGIEDLEVFRVGYAALSAGNRTVTIMVAYFQSTDGKSDCQLDTPGGGNELTFSLSQSLG